MIAIPERQHFLLAIRRDGVSLARVTPFRNRVTEAYSSGRDRRSLVSAAAVPRCLGRRLADDGAFCWGCAAWIVCQGRCRLIAGAVAGARCCLGRSGGGNGAGRRRRGWSPRAWRRRRRANAIAVSRGVPGNQPAQREVCAKHLRTSEVHRKSLTKQGEKVSSGFLSLRQPAQP